MKVPFFDDLPDPEESASMLTQQLCDLERTATATLPSLYMHHDPCERAADEQRSIIVSCRQCPPLALRLCSGIGDGWMWL